MVHGFKVEGAAGYTCVVDFEAQTVQTVYPIVGWCSLLCLILMYGMNGYNLHSILKTAKLQNDPIFNIWRKKFEKTSYLMVLII
jgi:hypothetical protein